MFAARIRWQAEADPAWELETHHPGFSSAEDAALFANGYGDAGVADLRLDGGNLLLTLTDGSTAALAADGASVWHFAGAIDENTVARDVDFERVDLTFSALSSRGIDGGFVPLVYAVLGPNAEPLDVSINVDELGMLRVTVERNPAGAPPPPDASLLFGVIPRA